MQTDSATGQAPWPEASKNACLAGTTAAALSLGAPLAHTSAGLLIVPLLGWALWGQVLHPVELALCAASVIAALVQAYFALRVRFDAQLFRQLSHAFRAADAQTALAHLDFALQQLGLVAAPPEEPGAQAAARPIPRPLTLRARGALALLKGQLLCLAMQGLFLALALVLVNTR